MKKKGTYRNRQEQTRTDRNRQEHRQEQTGSKRNSRNRQDYMSDIENYYNIKKFISNVRILKAKRSDRISEEQRKLLHH